MGQIPNRFGLNRRGRVTRSRVYARRGQGPPLVIHRRISMGSAASTIATGSLPVRPSQIQIFEFGAGGGTRTRTDFRPTDFHTRYDFRRRRGARRLESGLSLRPAVSGLGAARLVSTPSGETRRLGSGSAYVHFGFQLSPNLSGSASGVSAGALNRSSLLCLPVPPRPHLARSRLANHGRSWEA